MERETHNWEGINDDSLVELARQGKQAATDQLFSRHICALRHMAIRFLRNEAEAEDVVQDSLMAAFIHLPQYAGRSQFRTWLFSILLNAARTRVRSRRPDRNLSLDDTPAAMALPDVGPTPDQAVEIKERGEIVREALNDLSPEFRIAYHLCFVKGFSAREAAALTGVNPETFKVRLFRGKRRLANKLVILNEKRHGAHGPQARAPERVGRPKRRVYQGRDVARSLRIRENRELRPGAYCTLEQLPSGRLESAL